MGNTIYFPLDNSLLTASIFKDIFNGILKIDEYAKKGHEHAQTIAKRDIYTNQLLHIYSQL